MNSFNIISSRRDFLSTSLKLGAGAALASLLDIPLVMKQALATEGLGRNGKKLFFIFLRGANDSLNSCIPIQDDAYNSTNRPNILIPKDPGQSYSSSGAALFPENAIATDPTYNYGFGLPLGNGFAALHPSLKFLAPLYNAGDLALVHRVGYPKQSRSHFNSQAYWESADPGGKTKDGVFYRTMIESGLANTAPLTAVSFQSSLPLTLRGSQAAMTNLKDPERYDLLGIPNSIAGNGKADQALRAAMQLPFPQKKNRDLLSLQYKNLLDTLQIFAGLNFTEAGNTYVADAPIDGETQPYYLFPTTNSKNGGYAMHNSDPNKYVVNTTFSDFFKNIKAAAIILNKTDAIVAGTELGGFDTHSAQGGITGTHARLQQAIGWALSSLKQYFTKYSDKTNWNDIVVVTLSEFGRTTIQNSDAGTDHAEAGVMFVAGGAVKGFGKGNPTGVFGCSPSDSVPWKTGQTGSMFGASSRYLKRAYDYRSVLGKLIRDHLGASQEQLNRIIPGYTLAGEALLKGGTSTKDGTLIMGEPPVV